MKLIHITSALTCLGLSLGAVAIAQDLDEPAAALIAEFGRYKAAVEQFEDRYDALPGDFDNATALWGVAGGNGSGTDYACYITDSSLLDNPKQTCNGNGNGWVHHQNNVDDQSAPEWFRAWQHLANAELVEAPGSGFTGMYDRFPRGAKAGSNVPESAVIKQAGYTLMSYEKLNHPMWFPGSYFGFALGKSQSTNLNLVNMETRGPILPNKLAAAMDTKMDDGSPRTGMVRSWRDLPTCVRRNAEDNSYHYRLDYPKAGCALFLALKDPGGENIVPKR